MPIPCEQYGPSLGSRLLYLGTMRSGRRSARRARGSAASPAPPPCSPCSTSRPLGTARSVRRLLAPLASLDERDYRAAVSAEISADGDLRLFGDDAWLISAPRLMHRIRDMPLITGVISLIFDFDFLGGAIKGGQIMENAKLCAQIVGGIGRDATRRLNAAQRRPEIVRAFWQQAEPAC